MSNHEQARRIQNGPGRTTNLEGGGLRPPSDKCVVLPGGIDGVPSRLLATPETAAAALVAARSVYQTQYQRLGLDEQTIDSRLRVFDQGRVRIMLGLFPPNGNPIDINFTGVAIKILRTAAEIWKELKND